ncbi:hypothetical protein [Brachyspira pulli]|uniref:hypothetical protein n=1 Tax=Brachyspira pulli TaxID=310721 RepID=UPI003005F812
MKTLYFILTLFLISCSNHFNNDIFSDKDINFKKLSFADNISYNNKHDIQSIKAKLMPLNNAVKLSAKEKNYIIENTGYAKNLYYIESIFLEENTRTTCLVGYMKAEKDSLKKLMNYINSMEHQNNILKDYFYINGNKNIQYKIKLDDTILFYVIFESKNSNYLVLNYTFPLDNEYDSLYNIANSINSVEFY